MTVLNPVRQGEAGPVGPMGPEAWINPKRAPFLAKGDGVTNDTAALQAAIDSASVNGNTMVLPFGTYNYTQLNFHGRRSFIIRGIGGNSAGAAEGSILNCIEEGAGTALLLENTNGCKLIDVAVINLTAAYTGWLGVLAGSFNFEAIRCDIQGRKLASGFDLDSAQEPGFEGCSFGGFKKQIRGYKEVGTFSSGASFFRCTFKNCAEMPVTNPDEAWEFLSCIIEPLEEIEGKRKEAFIECVLPAEGLGITGCWFGDGSKEGTWIKFKGGGLAVGGGCEIGAGLVAIEISAETVGFDICGNKFEQCGTAVKLNPGCLAASVLGNDYVACTKNIDLNGATPSGIIHLVDGVNNPVSIGNSLAIDGDSTSRLFLRTVGSIKSAGALEANSGIRTNQGLVTSLTLSEEFIFAAGSNANQGVFVDGKGTGQVKIATRGLATGGTLIGAAGTDKIGFYGHAPAVQPAAIASPAETLAALKIAVDAIREALKSNGNTA